MYIWKESWYFSCLKYINIIGGHTLLLVISASDVIIPVTYFPPFLQGLCFRRNVGCFIFVWDPELMQNPKDFFRFISDSGIIPGEKVNLLLKKKCVVGNAL